ncbi:hypothetical protein EVJ58_g3516 [Rhodofomes roseus]|uniref:Uncharacterized protein n=1 Tax=Rhodofomes roseus TaxID=34475 RepID=A0A4Y9YMR5_9APHY|nr:hypothetical protein EVJ58_g3516 [Rhodofomes roseus]
MAYAMSNVKGPKDPRRVYTHEDYNGPNNPGTKEGRRSIKLSTERCPWRGCKIHPSRTSRTQDIDEQA